MLKQIIASHSAEIGLLLFVVCFITIAAYAMTRSRTELDRWSGLPLSESDSQATDPTRSETNHA